MKTTGIVRRIDAGVIITPKPINPHKYWVFANFCPIQFAQNFVLIGFSIKKVRCSLHIMMPDERYVHPDFDFLKDVLFKLKRVLKLNEGKLFLNEIYNLDNF